MSDDTYYVVLVLPETATQDEIERRRREFMAAYLVLSDSTLRSSYDQMLARQRQQKASTTPPSHPLHEWNYPSPQPQPLADEWGPNWGALAVILFLFAFWCPLFVSVFDR